MLESKRLITARCFIIINWNVCFKTIFEMKTNSNVERLAFRIPTTWWYQSQLPNESLNSGNKFHITMIDECLYYFCWWYLRLYTILNEKKVWQERKKAEANLKMPSLICSGRRRTTIFGMSKHIASLLWMINGHFSGQHSFAGAHFHTPFPF